MRALKLCIFQHLFRKNCVTTQAHEGIETYKQIETVRRCPVTTQAHEGIETLLYLCLS